MGLITGTAVLLVLACMLCGSNVVEDAVKGVTRELQALKQPVDETITDIGSSHCDEVKKLVGVSYKQLEEDNQQPDLNELTLELRSKDYRTTYNISTAAEHIADSKDYLKEKLVIFIHGFIEDPSLDIGSFDTISDSFLETGKTSIIALNGHPLIKWLYLRSSTYVRFMGEKLGAVLAAMIKHGIKPENMHLIGHSLGAHIAGFTGKSFHQLTGQKVARISGLDPAGPCFSDVKEDLRLKDTDAEFVDVMHTDDGVYGLNEPVGHVDFFPNSGAKQPNCLTQVCSHARAFLYYAESVINPEGFLARKCTDWDAFKKGSCSEDISVMGYGCKPNIRGLYFLRTEEESPYGLGTKGLTYDGEKGLLNNVVAGGEHLAKSIAEFGEQILG